MDEYFQEPKACCYQMLIIRYHLDHFSEITFFELSKSWLFHFLLCKVHEYNCRFLLYLISYSFKTFPSEPFVNGFQYEDEAEKKILSVIHWGWCP